MNEKLPPLPEPVMIGQGPHREGIYGFTHAQVEAIRREAVMLCAQVCQRVEDQATAEQDGPRDALQNVILRHHALSAHRCAERVRALLAAPDSRGQSEPARSNEHAHPVIGVVLPSQSVRIGGEGEKL